MTDEDSKACGEVELNCWESTRCGFEEGGENALKHGVCPAYPDMGRECTSLQTTQCRLRSSEIAGTFPLRNKRDCHKCRFYHHLLSQKYGKQT